MTLYRHKFSSIAIAENLYVIISAIPFQNVTGYRTVKFENITRAATRISNFSNDDYVNRKGRKRTLVIKWQLEIAQELTQCLIFAPMKQSYMYKSIKKL